MDNRKFEQLIDMIINENEEQARELFHEIVVEKSRQIYESMMDEEMMDETAPVDDLMDEIESDHMMEDDDEGMIDDLEGIEGDEEDEDAIGMDMDQDEEDYEEDEGDLEDRVVDLEDKLDELMAEFESIMGREEGEEDFADDDMSDEDEMMEGAEEDDMDESVMESVQLKKVPGLYDSKIGGDNGAQTKSTVSKGPKVPGNGAAPVKFSGGADEKGRSAPQTKDVDGATKWQNAAGKSMAKPGKAPAPVKSQASGVNTKDVVPGN